MSSAEEIPQPLQNIGCQDLLKTPVQHCGWLRKRHFINKLKIFNWPQVYTVLSNGCIYYFKDEYSKATLGKFSLYGYNFVRRSMKITPKQCVWAFEITHTHAEDFRTYYFATGSEQEMKEWMKHVKAMLLEANKKQASDYHYTYKKAFEKDKDMESVTYQEIEMKIYDDSANFLVSTDYKAKFQIKGKDEESDDDEPPPLPKARTVDKSRPAQPLPDPDMPRVNAPAVPPRRQGDTLPHQKQKKTLTKQNTDPGTSVDKKHRHQDKRRGSDETSNRPKKDDRLQRRVLPELPKEEDQVEEEEDDEEDGGYWKAIHFNSSNGEKASEIIKRLSQEGTFLVRDGSNGGKVLVVHVASNAKKYEVKHEDDKYFLKKGGPIGETLEDLLYQHHSVSLPTCQSKLTLPFRLHPDFDKSMIL